MSVCAHGSRWSEILLFWQPKSQTDRQTHIHPHTQLLSFHHPPCCAVRKWTKMERDGEWKKESLRVWVRAVGLRREDTHPGSRQHYSPNKDVLQTSCLLFLWHKHSKGFIQSGTGTNSPFTFLSLCVFLSFSLSHTRPHLSLSMMDQTHYVVDRIAAPIWSCASLSP